MAVEFLNSEMCEVDGKKLIFFSDPFSVFKKLHKTIEELGGEKFYSSTDPKIKKVRESMAEIFFLLTIKKLTGRDWFLMQPESEFPDFFLVSMSDQPPPIDIHGFELTEVPPRCTSFEEAKDIVNRKLKKGYPNHYSLLVFINNIESTRWGPLLHKEFSSQISFKEIWTLHMLTRNNNTELGQLWANRVSPSPIRSAGVNPADPDLWKSKAPPSFSRTKKVDGHTFLEFDKEFIKAFRQYVRDLKR